MILEIRIISDDMELIFISVKLKEYNIEFYVIKALLTVLSREVNNMPS
jgi:hypothetical protein